MSHLSHTQLELAPEQIRNAHIRRPVPPPIMPVMPVMPGASDTPLPPTSSRQPCTDTRPCPTPAATELPPATLAARQCYLRHTTPVPNSRSGFRQLGPVRMLVCFWQDRMSLLQIHSDARRAGHGSQAMALLVAIAERHGLHIVANALPLAHGNGCLDQRTLTEWYLGFGFQRIPGSSMNAIIYTPAHISRAAGTD
ncbi:hypothetical protein [Nitratidesulfovibrio liaohensis]|uniref:hypothetical protein n=1 Tax=Nitratidesulfovibrio liaohensis TaxID=2604158 RepID=UPI001423F828|nr:hypothetical protein [Nitratidesulfovibrio liaohensis]NHZ46755.1 hypothetical protein [Nitratidesulfovibrio liaohensis]